jgi:4-hydroxy-tetrahydrodipicolinate synthase
MTKQAEQAGATASLQVCPYYNKPEQHGLIAHFEAIARSTSLPLILYNIPGRTGRLIEVKTLLELAKIDNIVGVKDAAANINQTMALLAATRKMSKKFYVLSGEDALTFSSVCLGGDGAIAAVGHVIGKELHEMMQAFARGDYKAAQEIHFRTLDMVNALFIESNPVPVKTALAMMGLPSGTLRPPLVPMRPETRAILQRCLQELGKI